MILTNAVIAVDDVDVSGDANQIQLEFSRADLDATTFGANGKRHKAGMVDWMADAAGFWTPDNTDQVTPLGEPTARPVAFALDAAPGSPAFVGKAVILAGSWGGPINTLSAWSAQFGGRDINRGRVALYGPVAAPLAGGGIEFGALDADEGLVVTIHTLVLPGTAELEVQSSPTNGWSSPTTRDSLVLTATGTTELVVDGPVTDTWWRAAITEVDGPSKFLATFHLGAVAGGQGSS